MAVTAARQETHTFRMQPRGQLFGGIAMVATAAVLAAVIGAQTAQSLLFRILFGLGCLLYALFGERLARARVQVHDGRLIVHDYLRTRTISASDVREITWDWWRSGVTRWVVPRVHLANGGSIRLSGLWCYGYRRAELVRTVEEILSLLGVHVPVEGQPPEHEPGGSLSGVPVPVLEQLPSRLPDQAPTPASSTGPSHLGLPSESIGAPRPPHQFLRGMRKALPYVLGLTLGVLYIVSATVRVLVILLYFVLALLSLIRFMLGPHRNRNSRPRPSSRQD